MILIPKLESTRRKTSAAVSVPATMAGSRATIRAEALASLATNESVVTSPSPMSSRNAMSIKSGAEDFMEGFADWALDKPAGRERKFQGLHPGRRDKCKA